MFWLRFPALLLLPTEANTIVLKSLMRKCLFQWNFQDETQTDPESHTGLELSSPKPNCNKIVSQSILEWLICPLSFFRWNIHYVWETDTVVWWLLTKINSLLSMRQRKFWTWAIPILESPLATSNELEDTEKTSPFQKSKEITILQLSDFIFGYKNKKLLNRNLKMELDWKGERNSSKLKSRANYFLRTISSQSRLRETLETW